MEEQTYRNITLTQILIESITVISSNSVEFKMSLNEAKFGHSLQQILELPPLETFFHYRKAIICMQLPHMPETESGIQ